METLFSYLLLYGVLFGLFLGYGYLVPVSRLFSMAAVASEIWNAF